MLYELGTDISKDYTFKDGDLVLVSEVDSVSQSIYNRLNTKLGSLSYFYGEYGSALQTLTGQKRNKHILDFIKTEIGLTLKQDPRLVNVEVEVNYSEKKKGGVEIYITDSFDDDTDLSLSLVLTEDEGVILNAG